MTNEQLLLKKLKKIGITSKDFDRMPEGLKDTILSGRMSPLMQLNVPVGDNNKVSIPMKIQLLFDKNDKLQLLTYQIHRDINNTLHLNENELDNVRKSKVIQKEFRADNERKQRYVQFDKETNSLMYRDMATVKFERKLAEMEKVKDIWLEAVRRRLPLWANRWS